jgi:radical SAM superfamily enzyme YgiQ (UPF0313 family)
MKVLLVQTPNALKLERHQKVPRIYPLGLTYVASGLKNHQVTVFDTNIVEDPVFELMGKVKEMEPEIVGLSIRNVWPVAGPIVEWCRQLIDGLKKRIRHECKIIAGGPAFSLYPVEFMESIPEVNYGVVYEGEESLPELLENLENPENTKGIFFRKAGKIIFGGERKSTDFTVSPAPGKDYVDISLYQDQPYAIGVQTKRGCIFKCIYCCYPRIDGATLRLRHPKHVVDEVENLTNSYGARSITFTDNIFNVPAHHAEEICLEMIKRRLDIQWTAWFSPKGLTKEFVRLAKEAGCNKFELSPDGFSDKTLRMLRKTMTNRDITNTYHIFKNVAEIRVEYNFFFWPPGQDFINWLKMFWFGLKLKLTLRSRLEGFHICRIFIFANTRLQEIALEQGIIRKGADLLFSSCEYWNPKRVAMFFKVFFFGKRTLRNFIKFLRQ